MNIITTIAVDYPGGPSAHYPQIPYVSANERRLVYWRCACVFFKSSIAVNPDARHVLITNDQSPPAIEGLDLGRYLAELGVQIFVVPFNEFKPTFDQSKTFRNNFYKLQALSYAAKNLEGSCLLFDSDVIWLNRWPEVPKGLSLYSAFSRPKAQREPTGISVDDLAKMYGTLDGLPYEASVAWCGGEFIAGDNATLRAFIGHAGEIFKRWQNAFEPALHRFSNGASVFDNDEFLLSRAAADWQVGFTPHLKRLWTNELGGGSREHLRLAALHLPNEKLTGFAGLFDRLVLERQSIDSDILAAWCGIPGRRFHYESRSRWHRLRKQFVASLKSNLPRSTYNSIRSVFGRPPI
jgi:hypothetical protein